MFVQQKIKNKKNKSEMTYVIIVIPLLRPDTKTWTGTLNDFIPNLRSRSSEQDDGDSMGVWADAQAQEDEFSFML